MEQGTTSRQIAVLVGLVVAAAVVSVCSPMLAGGKTFADPRHLLSTVPVLHALAEGLAHGGLPEWWSGLGLGIPLLGHPDHAGLYPPSWIAALGGPIAIDVVVIAHVTAAAAGTARLARGVGAGPLGAAVAAGAAFAGMMASEAAGHAPTAMAIGWAPWVLWAADRAVAAGGETGPGERRSQARVALTLAVLWGAQLSTGQIRVALATAAIGAVFAIARSPRRAAGSAALLVGSVGGLLLAAHVIVPALTLELTGPPPFGGSGWGIAGLSSLLSPGVRYIGLPLACACAAAIGWQGALALVVALAGAAVLGGEWAVPALVLVAAFGGAGIDRALAGAGGRRVIGMLIIAVVGAAVIVAAIARGDLAAAVALPALAAAAVVVIGAAIAPRWPSRWLGPVMAAVAVGHSIAHARVALPLVPRDDALARPAMLAEEAAGARISRSLLLPGDDDVPREAAARARRDRDTLAPASATRFRASYARGGDRAELRSLERAWRASGAQAERFLDLYAVDLVVLPASVAIPAGMPVVGRSDDGGLALVRNEAHRARAFTTARWEWQADDAAILNDLFPPAVGERTGIRLATIRLSGTGRAAPARTGPTPAPPCPIVADEPDRVAIECAAPSAGYAVLLDAWAPGWEATVDGAPALVERADLVARAVAIERGKHRIEFRYRTPGLRWGGAVAALAWLNALVLAIVLLRLRGR